MILILFCEDGLEDVLFGENGKYVSDFAKCVDESIYFYVPRRILDKDEGIICEFVYSCIS